MRNSYPTKHVGNGAAVQKLQVSTGFIRLAAVMGVNSGADCFILIFEGDTEPAPGAVPDFHYPADTLRAFAFAMPNPVDLSGCWVVASSTLNTYTASAGTPVTLQALLAV